MVDLDGLISGNAREDQLAAAARQLQEALVPLTQALTASVAPAAQPVPPVVFTPGSNPMAAEAVAASAPAEQRSDDLLVAIRRGVLSALPAGTADEALIDRLIASVLAEMGACAAPETRPGVRQAGGVTHVDSKAQYWGGSPPKGMPPPWAIWIGKTSRFPGRSGVRKCSSCWKAT